LNNVLLRQFGLDERTKAAASTYDGLFLARVTEQQKDLYHVVSEDGFHMAKVTGKFMHQTTNPVDYPSVGDWVMVDGIGDCSMIHHVLPRKSIVERKSAGNTSMGQIVATNIDVQFICMSMNENYNIRRLERYLSMAWSSGATPCILLTKSDLTNDHARFLSQTESIAIGVDVIRCSEIEENGYEDIMNYLQPGKTYAFIGSSGVGKSTIVNHLMLAEIMKTATTGSMDKGHHTTTARQLFLTPQGYVVIDTPGMREIQLDSADFSLSFSDIEDLSHHCKFKDCTHHQEPKCAVKEAIDKGELPIERLMNYFKMEKELKYQENRAKQAKILAARWEKRQS